MPGAISMLQDDLLAIMDRKNHRAWSHFN
jgi:pyrroloquinoline quinone (PQQ) biosynthesis protein C